MTQRLAIELVGHEAGSIMDEVVKKYRNSAKQSVNAQNKKLKYTKN